MAQIPQTTVEDLQTQAFEGLLDKENPNNDVRTKVSGEVSAEIAFGKMVVADASNPEECNLPAAQADVPLGISVHSHAYAKPDELGDTGLKPNVNVGVLNKGRIWVNTEDAAGEDLPVRYRATATGDGAGSFLSADPGGTDTIDISSFARWRSTRATAGLALLEVDMNLAAGRVLDS